MLDKVSLLRMLIPLVRKESSWSHYLLIAHTGFEVGHCNNGKGPGKEKIQETVSW